MDQPRAAFRRRQASLQYFTSAQFLAQCRRQVMTRPQATQGLLGSMALLPRKVGLLMALSIEISAS